MRRRQLLLAAAVGRCWNLLWGLRAQNTDNGGVHSDYFQTLSTALDKAGLARPTLDHRQAEVAGQRQCPTSTPSGPLRLSRGRKIASLAATVGHRNVPHRHSAADGFSSTLSQSHC